MTPPTENSTPAHSPLDPRTLGRPVHLLGKFASLVQRDLAERLRMGLNRRYRAQFEVGDVAVSRLDGGAAQQRWVLFEGPSGQAGFALDRPLLLCILGYRYGIGGSAKHHSHSETATEERLAVMLGRQFVAMLADRIAALPGVALDAGELRDAHRGAPTQGAWAISAHLTERQHGIEGRLWLTLDDSWMDQIFRGLAPQRQSAPSTVVPLGSALQLDLRARLLETEMPLGRLLDARVGDIIPVDVGPTAVLVNDSLLFHADVAEHKGKLCLTSFQQLD